MKKQNKMGTYLAVTAGAGCAASVAEGALQFVDLSGISTSDRRDFVTIPGGFGSVDFRIGDGGEAHGYLSTNFLTEPRFYGTGAFGARGDEGDSFPSARADFAVWYAGNNNSTVIEGFSGGTENIVPFRDSSNRFGWLSFDLGDPGSSDFFNPTAYNWFVYDDAATNAATAPTRSASEAFAAAAVPEPSSLALLALGAGGLVIRRQRKKAA